APVGSAVTDGDPRPDRRLGSGLRLDPRGRAAAARESRRRAARRPVRRRDHRGPRRQHETAGPDPRARSPAPCTGQRARHRAQSSAAGDPRLPLPPDLALAEKALSTARASRVLEEGFRVPARPLDRAVLDAAEAVAAWTTPRAIVLGGSHAR